MYLVTYAGQETEPEPNPRESRSYDRFMAGADTNQLAAFYHTNEGTVLRWINNERSRRHGLPSPYGWHS
ncbi:MAG: hypothetical protein E5X86_19775 [Mesorhizobium sp.]|uniref:hypothetical protein n=1 Tax=Mesorhizobium sp. TaxID=1871066 RepID=UPI0011FBEE28|nr:hypothetical protein [Mesorhizobium sp.]TIO15611.1 MAG: hypothetical protein E5X86_19775 [Mesorhizobium sp.]